MKTCPWVDGYNYMNSNINTLIGNYLSSQIIEKWVNNLQIKYYENSTDYSQYHYQLLNFRTISMELVQDNLRICIVLGSKLANYIMLAIIVLHNLYSFFLHDFFPYVSHKRDNIKTSIHICHIICSYMFFSTGF